MDQLLPYASCCIQLVPNEHSQESTTLLYFKCDPYLSHLAAFLQPKFRYLGSYEGVTYLDKLRQTNMLAALNTKETHSNKIYKNMMKYHSIKLKI